MGDNGCITRLERACEKDKHWQDASGTRFHWQNANATRLVGELPGPPEHLKL